MEVGNKKNVNSDRFSGGKKRRKMRKIFGKVKFKKFRLMIFEIEVVEWRKNGKKSNEVKMKEKDEDEIGRGNLVKLGL